MIAADTLRGRKRRMQGAYDILNITLPYTRGMPAQLRGIRELMERLEIDKDVMRPQEPTIR